MANAIHTNNFTVMSGPFHTRVEFAEQLMQGAPVIPHSAILLNRADAFHLIDVLKDSLQKAEQAETELRKSNN